MTFLLAFLAATVVALVAFYVGVFVGARRGADIALGLVARDNLVRLHALGIHPAAWIAAGPQPSKTVLQ